MQPLCNVSRLCSLKLVVYDSPLPFNLTCTSQITQLSVQSGYVDAKFTYSQECVSLDVDIEWQKLTALQCVTILGQAKLRGSVLQFSKLPQLWHFSLLRARIIIKPFDSY